MADLAFHHGTRVTESGENPILIRTAQSAVVALVGIAPDADPEAFPLNTPVLIKGMSEYSKLAALGNAGTLKQAADAVFDQIATYMYVLRVEEGEDAAETLSNVIGDRASLTGVHALHKCESIYGRKTKPRLVAVPGFTSTPAQDGVAGASIGVAGTGYVTAPTVYVYPKDATKSANVVADGDNVGNGALTMNGTPTGPHVVAGAWRVELKTAQANAGVFNVKDPSGAIVGEATVGVAYVGPIRFQIADGATDFAAGDGFTITIGITGGTGQGAELVGVVTAGELTGLAIVKPGWGYEDGVDLGIVGGGGKLANGTASVGAATNAVVAELKGVLEKLRAVAYVDGPDTNDAAAVQYRQTINSQRIYVCDPKVMVRDNSINANIARPSSAFFAGVQAWTDRNHGFWWSLSNKPIKGIVGTSRPVRYGDHANYLNENHVNTVINMGEGFITWGNRSATGDDLWKFLSVRRTADQINEAIEDAYLEFVDKPFSKANLKFMIESGRKFMRTLVAEGAILGGDVWLNEELNLPEEMAQGRVTLGVKFEPPAPMEDIRLIAHREIQYYATLTRETLLEIQGGILSA